MLSHAFEHFRSFDNFGVGEYTLVKHKILPIAFHAFFRKCNHNVASCNCGVAAKIDDDVLLIDGCGAQHSDKLKPLDVKIFRNGLVSSGLRIEKHDEGNQYQVYCMFMLPNCYFIASE